MSIEQKIEATILEIQERYPKLEEKIAEQLAEGLCEALEAVLRAEARVHELGKESETVDVPTT